MKKVTSEEMKNLLDEKTFKAAMKYIARRDRQEHPVGRFDNGSRWYPDASEGLDTSNYRTPSRAFPYSYMSACRTIKHASSMFEANELAVKRAVKILDDADTKEYDSYINSINACYKIKE